MFDFLAASGDAVKTFLLTPPEVQVAGALSATILLLEQVNRQVDLLNAAIGQGGHPKLRLVLAVFQAF